MALHLLALLGTLLLPAAETPAPAPGTTEAAEIPWSDGFPGALKAARKQEKPIFVDVWAVWCGPCLQMDKTTYREPSVVAASEAFVPLKIDADVQTVFIERYRVEVYPTLLFLDHDGREISRVDGLVRTEPLLELMRTVETGYPEYLDAVKRKGDPEAGEILADYLTRAGNPLRAAGVLRKVLKAKNLDGPRRDVLELRLGEAQLAAGEAAAACKTLERLRERLGGAGELYGRVLAGLVAAERERGRDARAEVVLAELRERFPELATGL